MSGAKATVILLAMLIEIRNRAGKKTYITKSELEAKRKRAGIPRMMFHGAVIMDAKLTEPTDKEILFGPNHDSLPPSAPASWSPDIHRDYMKKYG